MSYDLYHNLPDLARNGGFTLSDGSEEKDSHIDWRFIASIEPARIIKESDFEKLEQCIPFLIHSSVGNLLNVRILDPAIARIYTVSQLSLQYLQFCTRFLDKSVYSLRENIFDYQKKTVKLEEVIEKRNNEIELLQKKLKRQDAYNQPVFPCAKCQKNFLSAALLESHVTRKHPPQVQESKDKDSNLINTIKLELEVKQLKERLNATEKELMEANSKADCATCHRNSQRRFQNVAIQSNIVDEKEKDDFEKDAVAELLSNQMKQFEELRRDEETRYRSEIVELRSKLDDTIEILKLAGSQKEARAPSPAPRMLVAEKAVGTSRSVESVNDHELWKTRYEELEKMNQENLQRMTSTVSSIEQMYRERMTQFETSMKKVVEDEKQKVRKQLELRTIPPEIPLTPKVIQQMFINSSDSLSSETEEEVKPRRSSSIVQVSQFKAPVEADLIEQLEPEDEQVKPKVDIVKPEMKDFTAQKFNAKPEKLKASAGQPAKRKKDPREVAEKLFEKRIGMFGISKSQESMSEKEFNRVHSQVVIKHEQNKKHNKSFFITRRKIQEKVDKILHQRNKPDEHKENAKLSTSKTELNSKNTEKEEKVVQVETTPAPSKIPVKQTFRDDLERMLMERIPAKEYTSPLQELESRQHEFESPQASHVPSIPPQGQASSLTTSVGTKKKVEFDLKKSDHMARFDKIIEMNEDDSDFDVSSFASEYEEPKARYQ